MNLIVTSAIAATFPLIVGFVYYHPKVLGNAWMKSINMTEEQMKGANMALIFGLTYVFSFLMCFVIAASVIHQFGVGSLVTDMPQDIKDNGQLLIDSIGRRYNTFRHGALHGGILAVFFALPIIAINALFERRGAKYIIIHLGFWLITLIAMGGFICKFADLMPVNK